MHAKSAFLVTAEAASHGSHLWNFKKSITYMNIGLVANLSVPMGRGT